MCKRLACGHVQGPLLTASAEQTPPYKSPNTQEAPRLLGQKLNNGQLRFEGCVHLFFTGALIRGEMLRTGTTWT